jgi:hypothetical protein
MTNLIRKEAAGPTMTAYCPRCKWKLLSNKKQGPDYYRFQCSCGCRFGLHQDYCKVAE